MNSSVMPVVWAGVFSLLLHSGLYIYCLNSIVQ